MKLMKGLCSWKRVLQIVKEPIWNSQHKEGWYHNTDSLKKCNDESFIPAIPPLFKLLNSLFHVIQTASWS